MAIIDTRRDQMFPVLDAAQIAVASRFASGPAQDFAPGAIRSSRSVSAWRRPTWC